MSDRITIGMDMGDRKSHFCALDAQGEVVEEFVLPTTREGLAEHFAEHPPALFALETGTHSAWVSEWLAEQGHEVLVGNARKLRAIWNTERKSDERDARMLARIARFDPKLLHPIRHRGRQARLDLVHLKSRDLLVRTRTMQVAHVRGIVKSFGERVSSCTAESFAKRAREELGEELLDRLEPILESIEGLDKRIRGYNQRIEELCMRNYPETAKLRNVAGVGPLTALAFVLSVEDPTRFGKSREVAPWLGLVPRRDQSGGSDKQLGITKAGNDYLRRLLVGASQYILGAFGPDCELRRFGERIAARGGARARRRAVVAVARKLAVLLHRLWVSDQPYDPFYHQPKAARLQRAG